MVLTAERPIRDPWRPRGAAADLYLRADPEIVLSGPAGTGKTRGCLEYLHDCLFSYAGSRALIIRKTLTSLVSTALVTYNQKVLHESDRVTFFGGNKQDPAAYRYPNGSVLVVGGMDKAEKVMSSEYDLIYAPECTELTEAEWEQAGTRLRWGRMPYQQQLGDCNPGPPTHWLKRRASTGKTAMLESRHEDNPSVTAEYLVRLDSLTGHRFLRLRKGIWAAAEGLVFDGWDAAIHLIDRFDVPPAWPRYWVLDFGYTNPFVCQWWAEDPDGRLILYREIYRTQRLVEDHAADVLRESKGEPKPVATIADHDAEGRATFERKTGVITTPAHKAVIDGIQAVAARLKPAGDGKPRLMIMRDSLVERDSLLEEGKPASTVEEIDGYVWDTHNGRRKGEEPLKQDDHGMDAMRYLVAEKDLMGRAVMY